MITIFLILSVLFTVLLVIAARRRRAAQRESRIVRRWLDRQTGLDTTDLLRRLAAAERKLERRRAGEKGGAS